MPSMSTWKPSVPMMQLNTMIPKGCIRLLPIGYRYLFCFRMLLSVMNKIKPLTKSKKLSNALVMMLKDPLLIAANNFTPSSTIFA